MSDLYRSRLTAVYTPIDGDEITIVRYGDYLIARPEYEWTAATQTVDAIGATWGRDIPRGCARRTMEMEVALAMPTMARLERAMRERELTLNLHRAGTLITQEAWHAGIPTMTTQWQAIVDTCTARPLDLDAAPPTAWRLCTQSAHAWGSITYRIILTHPITQ